MSVVGGAALCMRFDLTVPFARFMSTHGLSKLKRFHIGKVPRPNQSSVIRCGDGTLLLRLKVAIASFISATLTLLARARTCLLMLRPSTFWFFCRSWASQCSFFVGPNIAKPWPYRFPRQGQPPSIARGTFGGILFFARALPLTR